MQLVREVGPPSQHGVAVHPPGTRTAGRLTLAGGLVGAASALVVITWPAQVDATRYSYPFGPAAYAVSQVVFAVQHLALLAGLVALLPLVRAGSRATRTGVWAAVVGMVGLTACEIFALTAADAATDSAAAGAVDDAYGVPTVVLGLGLLVAGIGAARRPVLAGRDRWVVLALGIWVFVVLLPGLFGPLVVGRLATGSWMLLFAWLGLALVRRGRSGHDLT